MSETIGVVTISFNQGAFLADAIASVEISQPGRVEYVIVDPGSSDNSRQIIEDNRERFLTIILDPDRGPAHGLNKGFAALKFAEICGYINADDRFTPGALDYVCSYFDQNPSVDILLGAVYMIDKLGYRQLRTNHPTKVTLGSIAEQRCPIWQQGTFFRRSCLESVGGFNEQNRTSWDAELIVDMVIRGYKIAYTNAVLGEFRIHDASLTQGSANIKNYKANFKLDLDRMSGKAYAAGIKVRPKLLARIALAWQHLNPHRQAIQLGYGLLGKYEQMTTNTQSSPTETRWRKTYGSKNRV